MFQGMFGNSYEDLSAAAFKETLENTANAVLIDVRTPAEFDGGAIQNAKNIDIMSYEFGQEIAKLSKDKTYMVYCRSGNRSGQACAAMSKLGLTCYNLAGGISSWPY
ncbi:MAG: rhodanese-like domain-containing protein [Bacteroidia bacterium]|jgi:rhodanese-related sulfurtransferase